MPQKNPARKEIKKKRVEKDITDELYIVREPVEELKIREFKWTPNQSRAVQLLLDPKVRILMISGRAGTAKTLVSIYSALQLLKEKKINDVVYIRSAVESSAKSIGFLPGSLEEKTNPFSQALTEKLDELLPISQVNSLLTAQTIRPISNQYIRGVQWNSFVIVDEAQNFEVFELTTILTRLAEGGKMIILGDPGQSDVKGKSGFQKFFDLFNDEESKNRGIETLQFGREDIKRSKILSYLCDKIETLK